jgi:uncharacterized membrane protein (DUF4010 family)
MMNPGLSFVPWARVPMVVESLGIGAVIGLERQSIGKHAGVRTFALVAFASTLAWWQSPQAAYGVLVLCVAFVAALNIRSLRADKSLEMTTSVAVLATSLLGILVAQRELILAGLCAVVVTGLLAWKEELSGFADSVTAAEVRGAIRLAMIGVVIYPLLPVGSVDPWGFVNLREAWVAVLAISAIGFLNYLILRIRGARGIGWTGLLGGFVNSRAVAVELARQARGDPARFWPFAIFGILAANAAMVVRNTVILALFAPAALWWGWLPLGFMFGASVMLAIIHRTRSADQIHLQLESPVSLKPVLSFGLVFLAIGTAGEIAQRVLGHVGFLLVTVLGGLVSSASSVVAAAALAGRGTVQPGVAAYAVVLASMTTLLSNVPVVQIAGKSRPYSIRTAFLAAIVVLAGLLGLLIEQTVGARW